MGLPFRIPELAQQIARVIHPSAKGSPLDSDDLLEEQQAYDVAMQGLIANDEYIENRVNSLLGMDSETLLYRHDVSEGLWQPGFDIENHGAPDEDPATSACYSNLGDLETYRRADGTIRLLLVYPNLGQFIMFEQSNNFVQDFAAGTGENVVTNFRVIAASSAVVLGSGAAAFAGFNTATSANALIEGNTDSGSWWYPLGQSTLFQGAIPAYNFNGASTTTDVIELYGIGEEMADLTNLHPPGPQDAAIADNAARIAVLEAGVGGVTAVQLADAKAAVEAAQAIRDQAQDDAAAAEESEDDTENTAQNALIAATEQLAAANAVLAAANAARIAELEARMPVVDWEPGITVTNLQLVIAPRPEDGELMAYRLQLQNSPHTTGATFAPNLYDEVGPASDALDGFDNRLIGGLNSQWTVNPTTGAINWTFDGSNQLSIARRGTGATTMILREGENGEPAIVRIESGGFSFSLEPSAALSETYTVQTPDTTAPGAGHVWRSMSGTANVQMEWAQVYSADEADAITDSLAADIVALDAAHATTVQTLNGLVASFATEQTNTAAQFTAFDTRIQALEGFNPAALIADITANMADITANDGELMTLMTQVSQNATAQQANATAITANANALATEATDRQAADDALQQDIETRDAENVKLSGDQEIDDVKNFTGGDTRFSSPSNAIPGTLRMMFGNALAGLIRYATGDLQITHFRGNTPGARLLLSELFGNFSRRMEFEEEIDARGGVVNLFDNGGTRRIAVRSPASIGADYNLVLPPGPPLPGQVLGPDPNSTNVQQMIWQYPPGFGFVVVRPAENTNTVNDMTDPGALVGTIDTAGFVPGTYEIEVVGAWSYNAANSNYMAGIYDEATASNVNNGFDSAIDGAYFAQEPQDSAGLDPDGGAAGTDNAHAFTLKAFVVVAANSTAVYSYRHRPQAAGIAATAAIKMTAKRVAN